MTMPADTDRRLLLPVPHGGEMSYSPRDFSKGISLFTTARAVWENLYADCQAAEKSIEFEQYIIRDDAIGIRFLNLFAAKALQGVRVRLLLDRVGSRRVYHALQLETIKRHGGEVIFYNPVTWFDIVRPAQWFPRNHAKAVLIDSRVAYVGSACFADYMGEWRELHARLTGASVVEIERNFAKTRSHGGSRRRISPGLLARKLRYQVVHPSAPNPVYNELLSRIAGAEKTILLATPYFMPPGRLRRALYSAVKRGVDVRIIVSAESDVPLAAMVSSSYFPDYIRHGIRILSYRGTVFHAKFAVIDDEWAMLGSTNMDYLSLLRNRESNIIMSEGQAISALSASFTMFERHTVALRPDFLQSVPWPARVIGYTGRCIKRLI